MYVVTIWLIVLLISSQSISAPYKPKTNCGYDSCNLGKPDKLNVHLVPHTHDDVGWLKTVDQYYYGSRRDIVNRGVQYIIDSIIAGLLQNPDRRYIYVEIAFFWRWWNEQSDDMRNTVRQLVNEGRLEFISGGWCMNDEATTHYNSIIDQHSLGAEFLLNEFGECARPKVGWQIDPFGHSREVASLFAQMGFDGLFFGRADYQDRVQRVRDQTLEMMWKASANLDRQSWLFTGLLPLGYSGPASFCFDMSCDDPPIMDDKRLNDYNVPERVKAFIDSAHFETLAYDTNHIIMTMGNDFEDRNANEKFKNLDKLIYYVNLEQENGSDVNVFYSTPSCYLYALNKAGRKWSSKTDDFFPYASVPFAYWTGYYTSRPALKRYERFSNNILQVTRQINGFAQTNLRDTIFYLSEPMGIAQHHDAVSGTEKQEVAFDYAQRLSEGIDRAMDVINNAYSKLLPKQGQHVSISNQFLCSLSNISECLIIEGKDQFTLTLWNPTIHPVTIHPRVPVTRQYSIRDPSGNFISAEYLPVSIPTKNIPGRTSSAQYQYIFEASLPALGYNTYYFEAQSKLTQATVEKLKNKPVFTSQNEECILENEHIRVEIDQEGNLKNIINLDKGLIVNFIRQGFYWYAGFPGGHLINPEVILQASGAYLFRPLVSEAFPTSLRRTINCTKTDTVHKASIIFNEWTSQEITLFQGSKGVEVEWTVGPIPIENNIGKEIILRYETNIVSESKYYTDANGREVLERIRNHRPTWHYVVDEPVSGNYYPINSRIWIRDKDRQFTILTDRSQGGGSIQDGSIEIMVHRRLLHDDSLGVGEALNETAYGKGLVVTGKHFLLVDSPSESARLHRVEAQQLFMHPLATFALPNTTSYTEYSNNYHQTWSAVSDVLPLNVHLLTFDQLDNKKYLVRVEHYFELNEDEMYSQPVTFDLQLLLKSIGTISDMLELTLAANLPLSDLHRLEWMTTDNQSSHFTYKSSLNGTIISLNPMQIRTFQIILK